MTAEIKLIKLKSYIQEAVIGADKLDKAQIDVLLGLANEEIDSIKESEETITAADTEKDMPKKLAAAAKAVRLAGEYPYYTAKVIAVWFAAQPGGVARFISAKGIKAAVKKYCGIKYEYELVQMIAESFELLPDLNIGNKEKTELIKEAYRQGYHYEMVCRGCAQCHMAAVSDVTGIEDKTMFRAANGLAAGMGLLGDGTCGGYSGGILSLGLFAGRRREFFDGDKQEKDMCTKLVGKLHDKFIATYGSVICHDIHKDIFGRAFHITRPEDKEAFELAGAHKLDKCPAVVGTSAAWVAEILYDEGFLTGKGETGK